MNIQGKTLDEAVKRWKEIPNFMDDQDVDHGKDKWESIDFLFDFHFFLAVDQPKRTRPRNTRLSTGLIR